MSDFSRPVERSNFLPPAAVAFVSLFWFALRGPTALDIPAIDMAPFFLRAADPAFAPLDFFTDASTQPNPRLVFGSLVLALSRLFQCDWYTVLFVIKVVMTVCLPVLVYAALLSLVRQYQGGQARGLDAVLAAAVCAVVYERINNFASIAWWPPLFIRATGQSVAMTLGLAGVVLLSRRRRGHLWPALLLLMAATAMHPAVGLLVQIFWLVMTAPFFRLREAALTLGVGWVLPAAVLAVVFKPAVPLNAADFVAIYVQLGHPSHYDVQRLGSLHPYPWQWTFGVLILLFAIPLVVAAHRRMWDVAILSGAALAAYAGSVLLQYAGTVWMPNKIVASIGPSRFTAFGYWMAVTVWAVCLGRLPWTAGMVARVSARLPRLGRRACAVWVAVLMVAGSVMVDAPFERIRQASPDLFAFIESTPADSVFAVRPGPLYLHVLPVGRRPVFAYGFPFTEDRMVEYRVRQELLYGAQGQPGYFDTLTSADFARARSVRRLDYAVVTSTQAALFPGEAPVFRSPQYLIYRVGDQ